MAAKAPHRVCPWQHYWALDNRVRRLVQNPEKILSRYVKEGQTVLDVGCGPGMFSVAMAKMVGKTGLVVAVDVQEEMLQILKEKAAHEGVESRIKAHKSDPDRIGIPERVDFALAFYMVHEVPDVEAFMREIATLLKPEGRLLIVEPKLHVSASSFKGALEAAGRARLVPVSEPKIRFSRAMLFERGRV